MLIQKSVYYIFSQVKFVLETFKFIFPFLTTAIHSFKLSRNHVDWHSMDEVYIYSDATTSKIARTVTQKLGFSKGNVKCYYSLSEFWESDFFLVFKIDCSSCIFSIF